MLTSVVARIGGKGAANSQRDTLEGLGPIRVVVNSDAERDGLTEQILQTAVELRLRQNDIPLDEDASFDRYLYVNVNTVVNDTGLYAYAVQVALKQRASLSNGFTVRAATWDTGYVGMVGKNNLRTVREDVLDLVDRFSNDYLAVNAAP